MKKYIECSAELESALKQGLPVVALESTVISKGLPYPDNLEVALRCEEVVRENGALPATMGLIDGKIKAGLSKEEITFFAKEPDQVDKVNLQNISWVLSQKKYGATTVATTMLIAGMLGIETMATGGIGGVHLHAENTFDISSDLGAFLSIPVMVVCSGAKCILDIPKTLEYLETEGVPVIGYKTPFFPLFYCNNQQFDLGTEAKGPEDIRAFWKYHHDIFPQRGAVIANPVPDSYSMDYEELFALIKDIQLEAEKNGVSGKEMTPWLLSELGKRTQSKTIEVNKALLENNALVAATIASCKS